MLTLALPLKTTLRRLELSRVRDLVTDRALMDAWFQGSPAHTARLHLIEQTVPAMGTTKLETLPDALLLLLAVTDHSADQLLRFLTQERQEITVDVLGNCKDFPETRPVSAAALKSYIEPFSFDRKVTLAALDNLTLDATIKRLEQQHLIGELVRYAARGVTDEMLLDQYHRLKSGISSGAWKR